MGSPKLFQIGEMARLFHLSVSSIRHYEQLGLLKPEYTDPETGYRYYTPRQFEVFNTIRYLRALDLPLQEIADFLQNRDVDNIEKKLRQQMDAVVRKRQELQRIERKIDNRLRQIQDAQASELGGLRWSARLPAGCSACGNRCASTSTKIWSCLPAAWRRRKARRWFFWARWA